MKAKLYRKVRGKIVCQLCWRFCKLSDGEVGFCRTRVNKNGVLETLTYGNISAMESRPIEIKPFFHFKPGTTSMTFSTYSCNLECPWCQNWHISRASPPKEYKVVEPAKIVSEALKFGDISTCASFNEPTLLFEYLLDVFKIAKEVGLYNTMVSNGYLTPLALKLLREAGLDAINIDVKGDESVYDRYCGGKVKYVWKTVKKAVELGIHVEIINLVMTDVNDCEESIRDVVENHLKFAGSNVPLHFTRYFPAYMFTNPPTDVEKLEMAIRFAKKEGVNFVYIGNVPGHKHENTYCPECGIRLITRYSYRVFENAIKDGRCFNCGREIYGVW